MRVLVVGVAGALARGLALCLRDRGHAVVGVDERPCGGLGEELDVRTVDIRKRAAEDVFRTFRPECVVHLATVSALYAHGEERARINVGGTRAVFAHAVAHGVRQVVFAGRHTYYGAAHDACLYHTEDEPPQGVGSFPELADLIAADLFAANALWRQPELTTSVLRLVYTLGPSQQGTLARFLRGRRVPMVLGFDPLFHFMDEEDAIEALTLAVERRPRGIFNVAGPNPVPLGALLEATGRRPLPLPEFVLRRLLGHAGFPALPRGALEHLKHPIVVDAGAFRAATGFTHRFDELAVLHRYRALTAPIRGEVRPPLAPPR